MKRILLTLALALSILTISVAQSSLKARTKTFRNAKRFSVDYDKFKDQTTAHVGPFALEGKGGVLGIYARFLFPGSTVGKPVDTFYLGIVRYGREWQFLNTNEVYMLIDGERFTLEAHRGSRLGTSRSYLTEEWLTVPITAEMFQKIIAAKLAELKAGRYEAALNEEHQTAFRDLMSLSK